MKRWIRWAARLYPAEWRMRYGAEFDVLLNDATLRWRDLADVIRGAAIMRMTTFVSYGKMAVLAGIAGAVVAGGVAFAIHDQYVCTASLMLEKSPETTQGQLAEKLRRAALEVLGRDNLVELITTPRLDLYRQERARYPIQQVAEDVFRKHVHVVPYASSVEPGGQAFRIFFEYPDRIKARAVVAELVDEFRQQMARNPGGPTLSILETPITPEAPVYPNRLAILILGAIAGMLLGLISLKIWRRTRTYAVVTLGIPKETKHFVDSQVAAGQYRSVSNYVRELIRADEQRHK
jgi:hypothetical protein